MSIIRDPIQLFQKNFENHGLDIKPFIRSGNDINTFLNNPQIFYTSDSNLYGSNIYAKNFLTSKFGFDPNDETKISSIIQNIQRNYDFVIIA